MTALRMIKILQGRVVTQTTLGVLTNWSGKFPTVHMCKNYENWFTADKVRRCSHKWTFEGKRFTG